MGVVGQLTVSLLGPFGMAAKRLNDDSASRGVDPIKDPSSSANFVLMGACKFAPQFNPPVAVLVVGVATQLIPGSLACAAMTADQIPPCHLSGSTCSNDGPFRLPRLGLQLLAARFIRLALPLSGSPSLRTGYSATYRSSSSAGRMMPTTASQSGFSSS